MHNGDTAGWLELWSTNDPVTLFPALGPSQSGWEDVSGMFRAVAARFSDGTDFQFELVAAGVSSDLAYVVGNETSLVAIDGGPVQPSKLRVTHIYRRENGEWKTVHRHGDRPPTGP